MNSLRNADLPSCSGTALGTGDSLSAETSDLSPPEASSSTGGAPIVVSKVSTTVFTPSVTCPVKHKERQLSVSATKLAELLSLVKPQLDVRAFLQFYYQIQVSDFNEHS